MAEAKSEDLIPVERIAAQIYVIRGQSVMLDSDLAELYGVSTSRLNEQVKRNMRRFPDDFSFTAHRRRGFDVAICDIKGRPGRAAKTTPSLQ